MTRLDIKEFMKAMRRMKVTSYDHDDEDYKSSTKQFAQKLIDNDSGLMVADLAPEDVEAAVTHANTINRAIKEGLIEQR